jgi:hypothetical protein
MRVAPWDAPGDEAPSVEPEAGGRLNAMRSWLVSGVHVFVVDPRRRFGRHGRTRELLVVERPTQHEASERWQTLAAALHRHTVRDGLARLSAGELAVREEGERVAYLLPCEIGSVHLLVALIGAAYLARAKRRRGANP